MATTETLRTHATQLFNAFRIRVSESFVHGKKEKKNTFIIYMNLGNMSCCGIRCFQLYYYMRIAEKKANRQIVKCCVLRADLYVFFWFAIVIAE